MNYQSMSNEQLEKLAVSLGKTKDQYVTTKHNGSTYVFENVAKDLEIITYILQVRKEMGIA